MEPVPHPFPAPPLFLATALPGACQAAPFRSFLDSSLLQPVLVPSSPFFMLVGSIDSLGVIWKTMAILEEQ